MLYKKPKFSVPATEGKGDCSQGHSMPDQRGKCIRCGEKANPKDIRGERIAEYDLIPWVGEDGG